MLSEPPAQSCHSAQKPTLLPLTVKLYKGNQKFKKQTNKSTSVAAALPGIPVKPSPPLARAGSKWEGIKNGMGCVTDTGSSFCCKFLTLPEVQVQ